jgi:hypothetical protein
MADEPDSAASDPDSALRVRLFQYAEVLITELSEQIEQADGHLAEDRAAGVIGALDSAEHRLPPSAS